MAATHSHTIRIYYEDTDFSGFVYHAAYVKFLERGRTEFLRAIGVVQSNLFRDDGAGIGFVVSRLSLDYLRPARMDDLVAVVTEVEEMRGATLHLKQSVVRDAVDLVQAKVLVAAVRGGRAVRLPASLRQALSAPSKS